MLGSAGRVSEQDVSHSCLSGRDDHLRNARERARRTRQAALDDLPPPAAAVVEQLGRDRIPLERPGEGVHGPRARVGARARYARDLERGRRGDVGRRDEGEQGRERVEVEELAGGREGGRGVQWGPGPARARMRATHGGLRLGVVLDGRAAHPGGVPADEVGRRRQERDDLGPQAEVLQVVRVVDALDELRGPGGSEAQVSLTALLAWQARTNGKKAHARARGCPGRY